MRMANSDLCDSILRRTATYVCATRQLGLETICSHASLPVLLTTPETWLNPTWGSADYCVVAECSVLSL